MKPFLLTGEQRTAAKAAGIAIVVMTIAATVANTFTIGRLIVEGDAMETMKNILASKMTFNAGVLSWIIILICDVIAAWGLYIFLKPAGKNQSLIAAWFRLIYAAMLAAAIFNLVHVHILIHQAMSSSAEMALQLSRDITLYLHAFDATWSASLIVFGIHILLVGILALRSGFVPKIFGAVLIMAFAGYTIIHSSKILFPEFEDALLIVEWIFLIPMLGEVAFGIWLLIRGIIETKASKDGVE